MMNNLIIRRSIPLLIFISISLSTVQTFAATSSGMNRTSVIDQLDTIVFDLANGNAGPGYVEFPVYFISDDTINAVDFAFKFNQSAFTYDSIYSNVSALSHTEYLNPVDSVLRFTSFSIPSLANYTYVAWVRFSTSLSIITGSSFSNVEAYLNGTVCSYRFTDGTTLGMESLHQSEIKFGPNPADRQIQLYAGEHCEVRLLDESGNRINTSIRINDQGIAEIRTEQLPNGCYFLEIERGQRISKNKFMVVH